MDLINQAQITVGDYAYAGTWENPIGGIPSVTAQVRIITNETPPRPMGDKSNVTIPMDVNALIDPNGQTVSDGQGGSISVTGLPVITQGQFYLYFRKLITSAMVQSDAPIG